MIVICIVERIVVKTVLETGTSGAVFIAVVRIFLSVFKTKQLFSFFLPSPLLSLFYFCHSKHHVTKS